MFSFLRGNRAAFGGGSALLNGGWYVCGLLTAAYLAFLTVRFGPTVTSLSRKAAARPSRAHHLWPEGNPIDVEAALEELKSDVRGTRLTALGRLHGAEVEPGRQAEVIQLLEPLATSEDDWIRDNAVRALGVWGDRDSVQVLVRALDEYTSRKWPRVLIFQALERLKDPSCADAVAAALTVPNDMHQASDVLVLLGSAGEQAAWKYLDHADYDTWTIAFRIIQEIGTDASIPVVKNVLGGLDANSPKGKTAQVTLDILAAAK